MSAKAAQQQLASETPAVPETQYVTVQCECGSKGGTYMQHYDKMRCACGRVWWALRPVRSGPLIGFPWPGTPEMLRFRQEEKQRGMASLKGAV